tara:strand:- start:2846 stop:4195 length:1350 start_codon:yes stop_codon:yes gene_type:complete
MATWKKVVVESAAGEISQDTTGNAATVTNGITTASSVEDLSDVTDKGSGAIITAGERGNLTTVYNLLKTGSSTTINDGANSNSSLALTGTTAKLKTGVTEIKLEETSPGQIDFIVAAGASGSETAYTAATLSGTTTTDEAELLFKQTTEVYFEGQSSSKAQIRYNGTGNAAITLPTSSGTLALTDDVFDGAYGSLSGAPTIPSNNNQLTNGAGYTTFDGAYGSLSGTPTIPTNNNQLTNGAGFTTLALGTTSSTALAGDTALLALGTTSTTALAGNTSLLALGTSSSTALAGDTAVDDVSVANLKTALGSNLGSTTIGDTNDTITVGNDLIVTGDLTVNGDTTTVNTTNLLVDDTFISLNSGGTSNVDAGIVFEGVANKVFGWDNSQESGRFGVDYAGGDASAAGGGFSPDAWVSTVHTNSTASGQTAALAQIGNMYVNSSNQDIYIYS